MIRIILIILLIVILVYIGIGIYLYQSQSSFVYFPMRVITTTPEDKGLAYQPVTFTASDRIELHGWFIPAEQERGVVLYCHGNGGNIGHCIESAQILHQLGLSVLLYDYRGYGESEGVPSEEGTYRDAEAAWKYLVEIRSIAPSKIVIVGRSLGGAIATWLVTQHAPRALILESTFTSIPDMGSHTFPFYPIKLMSRIYYNTLERIASIHCPLLIVHSHDDDVIPYALGQQLYQAANSPKEFLAIHGTHNNGYLTTGISYVDGLSAFLNRYLPVTASVNLQ